MNALQNPLRGGRRLWIGIPSTELDVATEGLLTDLQPGGVILFRRNIDSAQQVKKLTTALRETVGESLHICIDQEGGRVVRFPDGVTFFPGNMSLGAWACTDPQEAREMAFAQGWHTGSELRDLGIDVNLAPCVDLVASADSRGIGSRSFGSDPQRALQLATALGEGMRSAGVLDCWKHFPGLGRVTVDPHFGLPSTDPDETGSDLKPFAGAAAAGAAIVMTSHVIARALDPDQPVTTSVRAVNALRNDLGFQGAVMTDCLEMGGVSGLSPAEVAQGAVEAGHDILLVSHTEELQREIHQQVEREIARDEGHRRSVERLDVLSSAPRPTAAADQMSGPEVAQRICRGGVSLLRGSLPPLPLKDEWKLILPEQFSHSPVEDPRPADELELLASELPAVTTVFKFDSVKDLPTLSAREDDSTAGRHWILALQGARLQTDCREILETVAQRLESLVILLLDDPRDLAVMPEAENLAVLCAYGTRPLHLQILAEVLRGETRPNRGQPL